MAAMAALEKQRDAYEAARAFVYREARILEQRLFARLFEGGAAVGVADALRAYRNSDGGFGHGLEPDKRCPESQPLDVLVAFETLDIAGARDDELVRDACGFLESVADAGGAVPIVLPSIARYPRAAHWGEGEFPPALSPTAGLVALVRILGVDDPWADRAAAFCLAELEREPPDDAHALLEAFRFLDVTPGAGHLTARLAERLPTARNFRKDPVDPAYGLTPLDFAPTPASPRRPLFSDEEIDAHLDRLEADQQEDGGWSLSWEPPSDASILEWRGRRTIEALRVLRAYGRVSVQEYDRSAS